MSEIAEIAGQEVNNTDNVKVKKTPEYVLKANRDYYQRKKELDPEYVKKKIEQSKKWREEHREEYNAKERDRRQRKKENATQNNS